MTARDVESMLLDRCVAMARGSDRVAHDQREANVFNVAAMVVASRFPGDALRMEQASKQYFAMHPDDMLVSSEVVRRGWVTSLPRLRDMLSRRLDGC